MMRKIVLSFLLTVFILFTPIRVFSQFNSYFFKGKIVDSKSKMGLPGITIRVLNTTKGTITDDNGNFYINLPQSRYDIQLSSVGYHSKNLNVELDRDIERTIELDESYVQMSEVLIVAEDPGIGIIRRAIANKKKWIERLKSYQFIAYTKQTLFKEDSVASISESYSNGYWRKPDGYREKIFQKRQTENIKLNQNFASVGGILNFNDDELKLAGYTFTGPTAPNALDDYTFKLLKTYDSRGYKIYELQIIPTSRFKPLFEGIICIADSVYTITKVEVKPNDVFKIPFIKDLTIKYSQRFNVFDTIYWMPTDISIDGKISIKFPGLKMPAIGLKQRSILYDYIINPFLPDSIFKKNRLITDSNVKKLDSLYWKENKVLPLTEVEEKIYKTLDSTKTLDKQFRPEGPLMGLSDDNLSFLKPLEYADIHFNRVEGYFLGARYQNKSLISKNTKFSVNLGYGVSDKKWKWSTDINHSFQNFWNASADINIYKNINHRPDENYYPEFLNTLMAIFDKVDYRDYFEARGFNINLKFRPKNWFSFNLGYLDENEINARKNIGHGFLSQKTFRENPAIIPGQMRSTYLGIDLYRSLIKTEREFIRVQIGEEKPMLSLNVENSGNFLGSDFSFTKYKFAFNYQMPTFLTSLFLPPYLAFELRGGFSDGKLPPQRIFDLESASMYLAPTGVFKTMNVKEFSGDSYFEAHLEHNFRSLPFRLIHLDFIEEEGIEIITFLSMGKTWLKEETKKYINYPINSTDGWFTECGFGFSKIFLFLRTDFSWRLTQKKSGTFFFTIQVGNIL